jgi:O-succinylbenzoic acid--CoA ligase
MDLAAPGPIVSALEAWLAGGDKPWIVETSGSTGQPKRVMLSRAAVDASVEGSARRLGATGRWLLALPASYVAGVNVITRALAAGRPPVLLDQQPSFSAAVKALGDSEPTFVSLVPTQLRRLLDSDGPALRSFHTVLLGGGPIDPALRERTAEAGVNVVASYGSSETCGGCVYDGLPLDGVEVAVDADGRVRISGPVLFDGYERDPGLTAEVLVDGWFLTPDAGRIDEDGRLRLLGRIDDMVVTGGVNVPGPVVARRLREHPNIADAEVLGADDPEWGRRLVAFVVVATADGLSLPELRDWVAGAHPRAWAPRQLVVLPQIPHLPNGKADRMALMRLV